MLARIAVAGHIDGITQLAQSLADEGADPRIILDE
jgi:hypothetical protein